MRRFDRRALILFLGLAIACASRARPAARPQSLAKREIPSDYLPLAGAATIYRLDFWEAFGASGIVRVDCSDHLLSALETPIQANSARRNGSENRRERSVSDDDCVRLKHELNASGFWEMREGMTEETGLAADGATYSIDACEPGRGCHNAIREVRESPDFDAVSEDILRLAFGARK